MALAMRRGRPAGVRRERSGRGMGKLEGKVVVVTGASRGIGRDMALTFAAGGAKVVVSARTENEGDFRIPGSIAKTVAQIEEAGGEAIGVRCDVTDDAQIEALAAAAVERWGAARRVGQQRGGAHSGARSRRCRRSTSTCCGRSTSGPFSSRRRPSWTQMKEQGGWSYLEPFLHRRDRAGRGAVRRRGRRRYGPTARASATTERLTQGPSR